MQAKCLAKGIICTAKSSPCNPARQSPDGNVWLGKAVVAVRLTKLHSKSFVVHRPLCREPPSFAVRPFFLWHPLSRAHLTRDARQRNSRKIRASAGKTPVTSHQW
jgi:hypothetical protein